jgi:hypothetical protein
MRKINFRERIPQLSEEHIKQICRFANTPYVEGEWQKARAYAEFKRWHHIQLKQRDELKKKIREIEHRSKKYPPVQFIMNEYLRMKKDLVNLELGGNTE